MTDEQARTNDEVIQIAPHSVLAEEAVLGAVLINPESLLEIKDFLTPDHFFILRHQWVFKAILNIHNRGEQIDNLTVIEELRTQKLLDALGGSSYITYLINSTPTHIHCWSYARLVLRAAVRRNYMVFAQQVANLSIEEDLDVEEITQRVHTEYQNVTVKMRSRTIVSGRTLIDEILNEYEDLTRNPAEVRGFSTGIDQLDKMLMGFRPGLYAIGGASSMGKSTFTGGLVYQFATQGKVILVPTEIKGKRALTKIATDMAGIPYKKYLSGVLHPHERSNFMDAVQKLYNVQDNITIVDTENPNIAAIEAEITRSRAQMLIIDSGTAMAYQGMSSAKGNKSMDLRLPTTLLCQQLQNIARAGVCVVATWQTGRNAKSRESKIPRINDFKEAGAVEETADVCLALYRHDYYVSRQEAKPDNKFPAGTATVFVLKDRDGGSGDDFVTLGFRPGHGFTAHIDTRIKEPNGRY